MGAEGKSPPKQRKRMRSPAEPGAPGSEPRAKRRPGKAATAEPGTKNTNTNTVVMPHRPAAWRVSRQQPGDGPTDATAASRASDAPFGEAGSTPTTGAMVHVCGHYEKRFRSPGKLAQHERVQARFLLLLVLSQTVQLPEHRN